MKADDTDIYCLRQHFRKTKNLLKIYEAPYKSVSYFKIFRFKGTFSNERFDTKIKN